MSSVDYGPYERIIWLRRRDAVWELLVAVEQRMENLSSIDVPRQLTFQQLLARLKQFGNTQFAFFDEGFTPGTNVELVLSQNPGEGISVSYTFGTLIEQISNDLMTIQRSQEQRMYPVVAETLEITDRIAYHAFLQVKDLLDPDSTVLTYLHKSSDTRVIPYAPVALIGIPATCYSLSTTGPRPGVLRDLLAIPHELGHHLYWNGTKDSAENQLRFLPRERLNNLSDWLKWWVEEIFADVVSCLIGGPIAALSFQELQLQARNDWLLSDNGIHPVPALRPYIYAEILRQLGMHSSAEKLSQRWQVKLESRQLVTSDQPAQEYLKFISLTESKPISFSIALNEIGELIKVILPIFAEFNPENRWSSDIAENIDLTNDEQVEQLYKEFSDRIVSSFLVPEQPPIIMDAQWPMQKWYEWIKNRGVQYENLQPLVLLNRVSIADESFIPMLRDWEKGQLQSSIKLPLEKWRKILEFAGWSTEGPTDGNLSGG